MTKDKKEFFKTDSLVRSLGFLLLLFFIRTSQAAEIFEYNRSVRSNGMGGVYIFDPSDASSFLFNPALVCHTNGINLKVFELGAGVNGLQGLDEMRALGQIQDTNDLSSHYGKKLWFGLEGQATLTLPCFGLSMYDNGSLSLVLRNPPSPYFDVNLFNDYAIQVGGAYPISKDFSVGLSAKRITRFGGNSQIGVSDIVDYDSSTITAAFTDEGTGYGLDAGLAYFPTLPFNPMMSVTWKDVGATSFVKTKGNNAPPRIEDNLYLNMSFYQDLPLLGFGGGLEYRNINRASEDITKKLHLGAEVSLLMFDLRAGFNQGYTTYGLGMDFWLIQFDAAYYAVEEGAYAGQTRGDRTTFNLSMNLSFDANFNLTSGSDGSGKKRKLKKRR